MFFTSPISNITPALASVAMSRSDSRDSTTSVTYSAQGCSAYQSLAMSVSPAWPVAYQLMRTDSNISSTPSTTSYTSSNTLSSGTRRDSGSAWLQAPYRSSLHATQEVPSSYLSDDDLLFPPDSLPVENIPNIQPKHELTTEEQIAKLREMQERDDFFHTAQQLSREQRRNKTVRFEVVSENSRKPRRPSTIKRRSTYVRKGLNGPQ